MSIPTASNVIRLQPTGGDDTSALQQAIDGVSFPTSDGRVGQVELDGYFQFSKPLVIGAEGTLKPVALVGVGQSHLRWTASTTSDYAIRYWGEGRAFVPRISNVFLDCNRKCRGILLKHAAYAGGMHNVSIHNAREVGLDLVDCWGSECTHLVFSAVDGIAIRGVGFNNCVLRTIKISGKGESWPDPADTSVVRHNGTPVQTTSDQRAAVVLLGGISEVSNVCFELCKYPGAPLLRFLAQDGFAHGIRREQCDCADNWVVIGGTQFNVYRL